MSSSFTSDHRRRKRQEVKAFPPTNTTTQDDEAVAPLVTTLPAKKKGRGHPSKSNNFNFNKKKQTSPPGEFSGLTPAPTMHPISVTPLTVPHHTTWSVTHSAALQTVERKEPLHGREPSTHSVKPPEQYIPKPATPNKLGPHKNGWHNVKSLLEGQRDMFTVGYLH